VPDFQKYFPKKNHPQQTHHQMIFVLLFQFLLVLKVILTILEHLHHLVLQIFELLIENFLFLVLLFHHFLKHLKLQLDFPLTNQEHLILKKNQLFHLLHQQVDQKYFLYLEKIHLFQLKQYFMFF
jgi:hypothetical protein